MAPRADPTDQRFAHFCRTGDPAALGEVFDHTARELLHVAVWLVGNRSDAEDVLQRTFLQAIEGREQFVPGRRVMPWLMGLLANQAKLVRRELERRAPARASAPQPDPRDAAVAAELKEVVQQVQDELGPPYREVLTLHLEQGLNAKEIAARLGRPAGTVRTQLVRALERLRRRLPAGFVAGFAPFSVDPAALAATRTTVVEAAKAAGSAAVTAIGPAAAAALTGGVLMSKKFLLAGTALAVLVGLLVYQFMGEAPEPAPELDPPQSTRIGSPFTRDEGTTDVASVPEPQPERTAVPMSAEAVTEDLATLDIFLRWADTGEPAAGQGLKMYADGPRFRSGLTDAEGRCALAELPPGTWKLKPALGWEHLEVELAPGEVRSLDTEIVRTGRVVGRVIDERGAPVAGATVWLSEARPPTWSASTRSEAYEAERTDAAGRFEVFTRGEHRIGARCPGHAPSLQRTVEVGAGQTAEVELRLRGEGGVVRGRVVDAGGQPVAWARVLVGRGHASINRATAEGWGEQRGWSLESDGDGRFLAESVAPGTVDVQGWAEGFGPGATECEVRAGSTTDVVLALPPAAVLTGCVRNQHGEMLEGVWISTGGTPGSGFGSSSTHTAADGSFRLADQPAGRRHVTVSRTPLLLETFVELTAGEETVWNPVLSDRWGIAGIVVGPDGAPAERVYVSCGPESGPRLHSTGRAYPTKGGRFELPNSDPGPQRVAVIDTKFRTLAEARNVPAGTRDLVLRLSAVEEPSARVRGRVVDEAGNPVAAEVRVRGLGLRMGMSRDDIDATGGRWQSKLLEPGRYQVSVVAKGFGGIHALPSIELAAAEDRDVGDIVVRRPGSAVFRVFDSEGKPITADADCVVLVKGADGADLGQAKLASGTATVSPLPAGRWRVLADTGTGVAFGQVDVPSEGTTEVELRLQPRTECHIAFDCGEHTPPQYALLDVQRPDGTVVATFKGVFHGLMPRMELHGYCELPPGRYRIECAAEGDLRGSLDVTATAAGGRLDLTMPLRR